MGKVKETDVKEKFDKKVDQKVDAKKGNHYKRYSGNDPSWYKINDQIATDVFNVPFNVFPGTKEVVFRTGNAINLTDKSTPGVLALYYQISAGGGNINSNSAVNIAARSLYSWVRHWNSGHTNYESSDLMIYILALDEVFTALIEARRIYKTAMTYSMMNRNIPNVLLQAMQVDGASIRANLAQFRAGINLRIAKLSSLAMPNIFTNFMRHAYLADNVFTDSTARTSQFYVFQRYSYRVFNPEHTGGGALEKTTVASLRSYQDVLDEIDAMLDPILTDEDCNIMSGDILKSFGAENLYFLKNVEENEVLVPIFDEQYLQSIENANSLGASATIGDITQTGNVLFEQLENDVVSGAGAQESNAAYAILGGNRYYNSHKDNPNLEDVIEGTRLMSTIKYTDSSKYAVTCGTEVIVKFGLFIYKFGSGSDGSIYEYTFRTNYGITAPQNDVNVLAALSQFDWHPIIYPWLPQSSGTLPGILNKFGDLHRYTIVSEQTVDRMNDAAVMAEFGALLLEKKFNRG